MNAQRWIALGVLVLAIACVATSNVWMARVLPGSGPTDTPTPVEAAAASTPDGTRAATNPAPAESPTPTLNPVIVEMLQTLNIQELGAGIEPHITRAGDFSTIDPLHQASGTASLYRLNESQYVLRLDPFTVTNGPDLRVLLSENPTPRTSSEALLPSYLDLGPLQSPSGAQNYPLPEKETADQYQSVVIYSMSLNLVYTTAQLTEVRGQ